MKTNWLRLLIGRFFAGASLCATAAFAQSQTVVMNDLRTKCVIDGIPAAPALSATWTGACIEGRASGFGEIYAFSAGRIRYILRGHFNVGRLDQQESVRDCATSNCADDIARSILQLHEQHAAANPAPAAPAPAPAPATPVVTAPAVTPAPSIPATTNAANTANVVTSPLAAGVAPATDVTAKPVSTVPEREIRVPNATFRGRFTSAANGGAISGEGRVNYDDGAVYEGPMVAGRKTGRGTYTWPDGLSYSGDWIDDQQTGRGKMRFKNGDSYEGDVIKGVFQGVGTYTQASGDTYTGDWVAGKREGRGVSQKPNGQRYEGEWKADRREGLGVETFPDGSRYDGQWRGDQATGKGDIVFASGDAYTGEVVNGIAQGEGVYRWGSGDRFDGTFASGKPVDAKGKMTFFFDLATTSIKNEESAKPEPTAVAATQAVAPSAPSAPATPPAATSQVANNAAPALTRDAQCIRAFNAASTQVALRRFLESFPDDECGRGNIAKQKLAALVERERVTARAAEERAAKAKAFIGATVAYVQDFPYCVVGTGANCQRVTYSFNVRAMIRDFDVQKRTAQVQVTAIESLGQIGNVQNPLFAQGRTLATDTFRARMLNTTQTRTLDELGIGGL